MNGKLNALGLVLMLSVLIVGGCGTATPTGVAADVPAQIRETRDAALAYLSEQYGDLAPAPDLNWREENVTPKDWVGSAIYEFSAVDWVVTIYNPVVPPDRVVRKVMVTNQVTGFEWEGKVDAAGQVMEQTASEQGWFDPTRARDAALAYVRQNYDLGWSGNAAPPELTWTEENITPGYPDKPVPGSVTLRYTGRTEIEAEDWVVTVSYAVLPPEQTIYQVVVIDRTTGFQWQGEVDATGGVKTIEDETSDWNTYTNEKHGYSLRYPADCTFGPMPAYCKQKPPEERPPECLCFLNTEDPDRVFLQAFTGAKDDLKMAEFSVTRLALEPAPGTDLIEWVKENFPHHKGVPDKPNAKVGGIPAVRLYTPGSPQSLSYEEIYFIQEGKAFRIFMYDVDERVNRALYDQISLPLDITLETSTIGLPVLAWYGHVASTPTGAQFDDYLVLMPEGVGEIGLEGADEAVEAQIVALRDKKEPGKYAHFWGTLNCPLLDYGGCQLVVTRLRVDGPGPFFPPDPVAGWEGTLVSGRPGPRSGGDDYFVLAGDFPIQYGIDSADPALRAQLESLRDTGTVIRVWGELSAGVMDWNATRIQVTRIEVEGV
ncbi:MAG: hypothetical protein JSV36_21225 [Anaerolineae bacterium]|nr:MAG: hypothetical protein JSV36_21225 [Anaerolineae bacterium]